MLYSEFLIGTEAPDNAYTYAEYKRIEKIYNADNNPENRMLMQCIKNRME